MNLLEEALSQYGHKEIPGDKHNPEIVKFFTEIGFDIQNDETAWCAAFMNWCAMKAGLERTFTLKAKDWLEVGEKVQVFNSFDTVAIFHRGNPKSWHGHVGIPINIIGRYLYTMGGNQNNQTGISAYKLDTLIEYRKLRKI